MIPLIVYLVWQWLALGTVSPLIMEGVRASGGTAATALALVATSKSVALFAQCFAFFAIVTSLLGVAFSMIDFLADAWKVSATGRRRFFLTLLTFLPPFIFSLCDPAVFITALQVAGGLGESTLNGLIPIAFLWVGRYKLGLQGRIFSGGRLILFLLASFGVFVFLYELKALLAPNPPL